jgi:hypothetical protein
MAEIFRESRAAARSLPGEAGGLCRNHLGSLYCPIMGGPDRAQPVGIVQARGPRGGAAFDRADEGLLGALCGLAAALHEGISRGRSEPFGSDCWSRPRGFLQRRQIRGKGASMLSCKRGSRGAGGHSSRSPAPHAPLPKRRRITTWVCRIQMLHIQVHAQWQSIRKTNHYSPWQGSRGRTGCWADWGISCSDAPHSSS